MCTVELNVAPLLAAARRIAWNGVRRCCAAIRPKPSALYPGWSGRRKRVRQLCRTSSRIPKHGVDQKLLYQTLRARTFGPLSAPPLNRQTLLHKPRWDTQQDARPTRLQPTRDARGRRYNTCDENLRRKMEHVRRYVEPSRQPSTFPVERRHFSLPIARAKDDFSPLTASSGHIWLKAPDPIPNSEVKQP